MQEIDKNKLRIFNKSTFKAWKPKLDLFFESVVNGTDKLAKNYVINYDDHDDLTLITFEDTIVAFSTVYHRSIWPNNTRRVLNRFVRNKKLVWVDKTFGTLSKIMHDEQIKYCTQTGIDFAFISIQNNKKNYLKKWTHQANLHSPGWKQIDGMVRVCNGSVGDCVHHVTYRDLKGLDRIFPMDIIHYNQYEKNDC